ncbi:MAG: hypothetical protein LBJ35_01210 [Spirochaetaceae bacterium]|jgi:hypothetical protein|nr:hypothetical protein [Spirochaetaceae bacterium]
MTDNDYRAALEELDREFPGAAYDYSMTEYLKERRRRKEIKIFLIKAGICLFTGIILLKIIASLCPVLLIIMLLRTGRHG